MRDYNAIPFRSPTKQQQTAVKNVKDHPLVSPEEEKKEPEPTSRSVATKSARAPPSNSGSTSTAATSISTLQGTRQQQQQQRRAATPTMTQVSSQRSPSPVPRGSASVDSSLSAADALAIRRDGAEATVRRLRSALDESSSKDTSTKTSLARSDAVILELRSSVRQLKRQLEKVHGEKASADKSHKVATQQLQNLQRNGGGGGGGSVNTAQAAMDRSQAADARIGELQVQLDRAHAQMLTADMVRKELEDTLEAEQYTWELRVQDQERTIDQLQRECAVLADDLEACRGQWKEAEDGWTMEVQELQNQLEQAQQEVVHWKANNKGGDAGTSGLKEKLIALELERNELQSCLDEALKELEAVDAELQGDNQEELLAENDRLQRTLQEKDASVMEPLHHLYRWVLERDGVEESVHAAPRDARGLLSAIQSHLERMPGNDKDLAATRKQVAELEAQMSVYRGDLQAREESSQELRASLKEAVALLKPLQDAVGKAESEKKVLRRQLDEINTDGGSGQMQDELVQAKRDLRAKSEQIEDLQHDIESLELQLSKAKVMAATGVVAAQRSATPETPVLSRAREELKAKRAAEKTLKQLLKDAQTRFNTLHQQNAEVEAMNNELQGRLQQAEETLVIKPSGESADDFDMQRSLAARESDIQVLRNKFKVSKGELARKEVELRSLQSELEEAKSTARSFGTDDQLFEAQSRVKGLESKLLQSTTDLKTKRDSERKLNKSLKEALGLLKPLQMHLEEAEDEKNELRDELLGLRKRMSEDSPVQSRAVPNELNLQKVAHLESAVRQLEQENSQLHDALEDMSQSFNVSHLSGISKTSQKSESRLKEDIVEIKSRYEVTQSRLEDAYVENHTLVEALTKREREEKEMAQEIQILRGELDKAKFIATSALVKVEELTVANAEQLSLNSSMNNDNGVDRDLLFRDKSREFDREMRSARQNATTKREKVPYRLT